MALDLTLQMNEITEALIKGEISQEEALAKQRKLLGQEIPPAEPALSSASKIESSLARIEQQKADVATQLAALKDKALVLKTERDRLQGAIATSEQRLNILSGSPTQYRNAKAEAIAKGLLDGTPVDLESLQNENADLVDRVSATDLKEALKVLKSQMAEVERRKVGLNAETRRLSGEYYELHGKEHGIKFAELAVKLVDEYAAVQAAHRANLSLGGFSTLAPESFSLFELHSPLSMEDCREIGITRQHWNAAIVEGTTAIRNAQTALVTEMGVA